MPACRRSCPNPRRVGPHTVQLLRTYPDRRRGYGFAPDGERSYLEVLGGARSLIYLENQCLWLRQVAAPFAAALAANPGLQMIAVIPRYPYKDGRPSQPPDFLGHSLALGMLRRSGGDRVTVYGIENHDGTPVYVHAKACVIDHVWVPAGSDNFSRRSWADDSEFSCAGLAPLWLRDTSPSGFSANPGHPVMETAINRKPHHSG
jgi:phosphatidylserine/phosphatidylglycerophosphate/cardiolipin synthase-like enzyme